MGWATGKSGVRAPGRRGSLVRRLNSRGSNFRRERRRRRRGGDGVPPGVGAAFVVVGGVGGRAGLL